MVAEPRQETHGSARGRSCAGCGAHVALREARTAMLRLVAGAEAGSFAVDLGGRGGGRGAWVHARRDCLERAAKRGLGRHSLGRHRGQADGDAAALAARVVHAALVRMLSLLGVALRARKAVGGATAVRVAAARAPLALVAVARDAAAAARIGPVRAAAAAGRLCVLPVGKDTLGAALGREPLAVVGVRDEGIAAAVRHAHSLIESFSPDPLERGDVS